MEQNTKILIGVGGVVVIGLGVWLITRPSKEERTTPYNPNNLNDPSTTATDSLGGMWGNLITSIIGNMNKKNNNINCPGVPADPYTADNVNKADYSSSEVEKMQVYLSATESSIQGIIDNTGGVDGIIGAGFKQAYNAARKSCYFTDINDLESKSGI